ncbi:uncharacterized protein [Lolium perenne]|uniref:uncharacterized protein n=1 Tax=Lolium perenne TaxID=4522 RepID=UPI0021F62D88|nr:uncharacterized protein LOC127334710 [Lolium perenne]XP_051217201.1 uncharacterized protein LOC127334711 [Lolium perenne]
MRSPRRRSNQVSHLEVYLSKASLEERGPVWMTSSMTLPHGGPFDKEVMTALQDDIHTHRLDGQSSNYTCIEDLGAFGPAYSGEMEPASRAGSGRWIQPASSLWVLVLFWLPIVLSGINRVGVQ